MINTNVTLAAGSIQQSSPPAQFDCKDATLGTVSLSATDDAIGVFDHLRTVETNFDEFDFANHREDTDDG